jgi:glycosyltransferase involved in cell wall biosynthesis
VSGRPAIVHVAIVIPAADEEDRIGACLDAARASCAYARAGRPGLGTDIVVVLDGCTDRTADIVAAAGVRSVVTDQRCVGIARGLGSAAAVAYAPAAPEQVWLANTDADSEVPEAWLATQLDLADGGIGCVLGTVVPDLHGPTLDRWMRLHSHADGHRHVHGASFGIRADVLAGVGGWPALRTGEDVALAERVAASGVLIARSAAGPVRTSARLLGRAPSGFSSYVAALSEGSRPSSPAVGP